MEQLPNKIYKWTQRGGVGWNESRIQVGSDTTCPLWSLTRDVEGDGFGLGVCANPIEALDYLPPTVYEELYEVQSIGEYQLIRPGFWRCETVRPIRLISKLDFLQFNTDTHVIATEADDWVEVKKGMRGYAVDEGRIVALGGLVQAFGTASIYASGRSCVECSQSSNVVAIERSRVYFRGNAKSSIYDRAEQYRLN